MWKKKEEEFRSLQVFIEELVQYPQSIHAFIVICKNFDAVNIHELSIYAILNHLSWQTLAVSI